MTRSHILLSPTAATTTTTTLVLLLLSLLHPPPCTAATQVLDYFGNPIQAGTQYYVGFPGAFYFFGGLSMITKANHKKCPQWAGVSQIPTDYGPGIELHPSNPSQKAITLSSDLNIAFSGPPGPCGGQGVWQLAPNKTNTARFHITTSGVIGNHGVHTINNWYKIELNDDGPPLPYKLSYCPSVSHGEGNIVCGGLGISYDDTDIWLSMGDPRADPLNVYFLNASSLPQIKMHNPAILSG